MKVARFLVSSAAGPVASATGAVGGIAGAVGVGVSALDAFLGDRLGRQSAPRIFLDELRRTIPRGAERILNLRE